MKYNINSQIEIIIYYILELKFVCETKNVLIVRICFAKNKINWNELGIYLNLLYL